MRRFNTGYVLAYKRLTHLGPRGSSSRHRPSAFAWPDGDERTGQRARGAEMPEVSECQAVQCSYNDVEIRHLPAITVGGDQERTPNLKRECAR